MKSPKRNPGWHHDDKAKQLISQHTKRCWDEGIFDNRPSPQSPSKFELSFLPQLTNLGFTHTGAGDLWLVGRNGRRRNPDYANFTTNQIVEFFGDWHHRFDKGKEVEILDWYAEIGWDCLIIWQSETRVHEFSLEERLAG